MRLLELNKQKLKRIITSDNNLWRILTFLTYNYNGADLRIFPANRLWKL